MECAIQSAQSAPLCFQLRPLDWIPFGDHPLKLFERFQCGRWGCVTVPRIMGCVSNGCRWKQTLSREETKGCVESQQQKSVQCAIQIDLEDDEWI